MKRVALIMNVNVAYDRQVVTGIARYVKSVGGWSLYVENDPQAKIPDLRQWRGHGVIADFDDLRVAEALADQRLPIVAVGGGAGGYDRSMPIPYVATDNVRIAELAAEHLLERGLRRFAYCGVPSMPFNPWAGERGEAFCRYLTARGHACSVYNGRRHTPRRWESLQRGLVEWLQTLEPPFGLMACNDARARHALEALRTLKLRVPEDVAVLGVDNDELMCELATPPLSSVRQGCDRIGYRAAEMLDVMMRDPDARPQSVVIEPEEVVARLSTDVLAIGDPAVAEAIRFIREMACRRIQVNDVARHVSLSRSTLDNRFRQLLDRTVHDFIEQTQLQAAQRMLGNSELSLRVIAEQCGYNTVQYMTTVFRRCLGKTPGQLRTRGGR